MRKALLWAPVSNGCHPSPVRRSASCLQKPCSRPFLFVSHPPGLLLMMSSSFADSSPHGLLLYSAPVLYVMRWHPLSWAQDSRRSISSLRTQPSSNNGGYRRWDKLPASCLQVENLECLLDVLVNQFPLAHSSEFLQLALPVFLFPCFILIPHSCFPEITSQIKPPRLEFSSQVLLSKELHTVDTYHVGIYIIANIPVVQINHMVKDICLTPDSGVHSFS